MTEYRVDRAQLETFSTEQIQRILKEEYDDYTPEAIEVFYEILEERGVHEAHEAARPAASVQPRSQTVPGQGDMVVNSAHDAVRVLNDLLSQVLNGTLDPQVAQVAAGIVMGILRAREQEFMTEQPEDES